MRTSHEALELKELQGSVKVALMVLSSQRRTLTIAAALMLFLVLFAGSHTAFAYGANDTTAAPAHHDFAPHSGGSNHTECPQNIHQVGISRVSRDVDSVSPIVAQSADTVCVRDISAISMYIPMRELESDFSRHPLDQKVVLRL